MPSSLILFEPNCNGAFATATHTRSPVRKGPAVVAVDTLASGVARGVSRSVMAGRDPTALCFKLMSAVSVFCDNSNEISAPRSQSRERESIASGYLANIVERAFTPGSTPPGPARFDSGQSILAT